jgi:hypothetical protein
MKERPTASQDSLTDEEFLRRAQAGALERFGHADHLRLAFALAQRDGRPAAVRAGCRDVIRRMAAAHGEPDRYHESITSAWAHVLSALVAARPGLTFAEFVEAHPEITAKDYLLGLYSRERLLSAEARRRWVPPDLAALPVVPPVPTTRTEA